MANMMKMSIRTGDKVRVIAGKDKGQAENEQEPVDVKSLMP